MTNINPPLLYGSYGDKVLKEFTYSMIRAMTWQPIETAPRDGSEILCYEDGMVRVCWNFGTNTWDFGDSIMDNPTHWMPLPAPPTE